jgi:hypothetical protein
MTDTKALKHISHQIRGALAVLKVALQPGMLDDADIRAAADLKLSELNTLADTLDMPVGNAKR